MSYAYQPDQVRLVIDKATEFVLQEMVFKPTPPTTRRERKADFRARAVASLERRRLRKQERKRARDFVRKLTVRDLFGARR